MTDTALLPPPAPDPLSMLNALIERGADPDKLDKMIGLVERTQDRLAKRAYFEDMGACQSEVPMVIKDQKNNETSKMYGSLEAVQKTIMPTVYKHGFSLSFTTEDSPLTGHYRIVADVMHRAGHKERRAVDIPIDDKGPKGAPNKTQTQGAVSALSYGQRKLLTMIFNVVVAGEDKDGQGSARLSEEQLVEINTLIDELARVGGTLDTKRFLVYLFPPLEGEAPLERIADLPQTTFALAAVELRRKIKDTLSKKGTK